MAIFDFSEYQGNIDFGKVKGNTDLLILRVQAGSTHPDKDYATYVAGCKANNIPFGTYAYGKFISVADAQVEAKDCFTRMDKATKFVVIDVEAVTTTVASQLVPATQAFIDYLHSQGVSKVGLYSGEYFYKDHGLSAVKCDFLWLANYGINDGNQHNRPSIPCDMWQYSSTATENGVVGHVDIDTLNGSKSLSYFTGVESTVTGTTKQTIFLPASNDTWTVYKLGHAPSKSDSANIAGELAPKKFGGLTYDIKGTTGYADTYIIHTDAFGDVQIYGAPSTGAIIKTVTVAPPAPPTPPPAPAPAPTPVAPPPPPFTGLQNGTMATIKTTATGYATGEAIPVDVRDKAYKVLGHADYVRSFSKIAYQLEGIPYQVLEQDIVETGVSNGSPYPPVAPAPTPAPTPQPAPQPTPVVAPVVEPKPVPVESAPVVAPTAPTPKPVEAPVVAPSAPVTTVPVASLAQQIEDAVMKDPQLQKNLAQKVLNFFVSLFK